MYKKNPFINSVTCTTSNKYTSWGEFLEQNQKGLTVHHCKFINGKIGRGNT